MTEFNQDKRCPKCGNLMSKSLKIMDIMSKNGFGHVYLSKCPNCGYIKKFTKGIKKKG